MFVGDRHGTRILLGRLHVGGRHIGIDLIVVGREIRLESVPNLHIRNAVNQLNGRLAIDRAQQIVVGIQRQGIDDDSLTRPRVSGAVDDVVRTRTRGLEADHQGIAGRRCVRGACD